MSRTSNRPVSAGSHGGPGYRVVVTGGSAGGMEALAAVLACLTPAFPLPLVAVQHLHKSDRGRFAAHLDTEVALPVREAEDKVPARPGHLYLAPADYHLLLERDGTLSLSVDPRVRWSRPAIDVLFESAALGFGDAVIGIILSGASDDGTQGMAAIRKGGGFCIAQDPKTATHPLMPSSAVDRGCIDEVLPPEAIGERLKTLTTGGTP